jgi:hypothetical protein
MAGREGSKGENSEPTPARTVFVADFLHLPAAPGPVSRFLAHPPKGLLERLMADAAHRAAGTSGMRVEAGTARTLRAGLVRPLRWAPHEAGELFALEADLEVAPLGPEHTRLGMSGRYRSPLGTEAPECRRAAEGTIRTFLALLGQELAGRRGPVHEEGAGLEDHGTEPGRSAP